MDVSEEAIVKSLIAVAWADGRVEDAESEVVEALLSAFGLAEDARAALREFARSPRTLDDVPVTDLSAADRRVLLQHAVIVTYIDGSQSERERAVLAELVTKLRIPPEEADAILGDADQRARRLVSLL